MRKTGSILAFTAALCLFTGCGGGSGENFNVEEQVKGCVQEGTGLVFALTAAFGSLETAIANDFVPGSGIVITPNATIDQAWDFTIPIDADQNGTAESAVNGTITFIGANPTEEPLGAGDSAQVSFQVAGTAGLSGSGSFTIVYGEIGSVSVYGSATMTLRDGCDVGLTILEQAPLTYGRLRDAAADVLGSEIFGSVQVQASVRGHDIDCTLTLFELNNTIEASNVEIDGVEVGDFSFTIPLDFQSVSLLGFCTVTHVEGVFALADTAVRELLQEILDDEGDPNVTITPAGPASFTFTITDLEGGTMTGSVSVTGLVQANSTVAATIAWDWRASLGETYVRTRNGAPMALTASLGETGQVVGGSVYGTFDCQFDELFVRQTSQVEPELTCQASLTIDENSPVEFEGPIEFLDAATGTMDARGSVGGNNLHVRLMGIEGSLRPVATYLNGIPLPFFERFLFGAR